MAPRWLVLPLVAAAACTIDADYTGTRFACDRDRDCPSGFACVSHVCTAEAGEPGDSAPPAGCGAASDFGDDFDDGIHDTLWRPQREGGGSIAEADGDARFDLAPTEAGSASYATACSYDLTHDRVYVRVDAVARGTSDATTFLRLDAANGDEVEIAHRSGSLHMTVITNGSTSTTALGFSESEDRWWRLAGDDSDIEFSVSKDAQTWNELEEKPAPPGLSDVQVSIGTRGGAGATGARTARFDDYNGG